MSQLNEVDELVPQLRLLGDAELRCRGRSLRQFGGRPAALLLAKLALAPRRAHPREELIDSLWPDADLDAGRNRLRNALSVLRSALSAAGCEQIIESGPNTLRLAAGAIVCDVQRFEEAVSRQHWLEARQAYRGELLPGHFDDWVQDERARLAALANRIPADLPALSPSQQAAMALVDSAGLLARRGTPAFEARAIAALEQAIAVAPDFALPCVRLATTLHNASLRMVGAPRRAWVQRARALIERAIALEPNDPLARAFLLVLRYRQDLDFEQTRDALSALAQRWPGAPGPLKGLGMIHNDVGRSVEAEAYNRQYRQLAPLEIIHLYNLGTARLNGYRFAAALEAFDQMLELEPGHCASLVGRFFALAGLRRLDEARQQAHAALEAGALQPDELPFYLALCAHWSGDAVQARRLYGEPAVEAVCQREPAYGVLRLVHLGRLEAARAAVLRMRDERDPNLLVVFGSRNGLDTRRDPAIDAVALALGWRPLAQMLAQAREADPRNLV